MDAARAPHGDGNSVMKLFFLRTTPIQPAPLAGTATTIISSLEFDTRRCNPHPSRGRQHSFKAETETCLHRDATRTPYGDGNLRILDLHLVAGRCNPRPLRGRQQLLRTVEHSAGETLDATRTPRGDGNSLTSWQRVSQLFFAATRTPRGDSNLKSPVKPFARTWMQPAPLTGTATNFIQSFLHLPRDAARTPRGDGN